MWLGVPVGTLGRKCEGGFVSICGDCTQECLSSVCKGECGSGSGSERVCSCSDHVPGKPRVFMCLRVVICIQARSVRSQDVVWDTSPPLPTATATATGPAAAGFPRLNSFPPSPRPALS